MASPAPTTFGPATKPRSVDEEQVRLMLQVQTLLSAKCIDEDELKKAEAKLKDLTKRFDYGPAWLNLAELYSHGYEPGIEANPEEAARCYAHVLLLEDSQMPAENMEHAARSLASLPAAARAAVKPELERIARREGAGSAQEVSAWASFALLERPAGTVPEAVPEARPEAFAPAPRTERQRAEAAPAPSPKAPAAPEPAPAPKA